MVPSCHEGKVTCGILPGTVLMDILVRDLGKGLSKETRRVADCTKTVRMVRKKV